MQIIERLKERKTLSFEVFPPKADRPIEPLLGTLEQIYGFSPDFISCTYGACGTNKGRNLDVVRSIQQRSACEALSHFTCVGHTQEDVFDALNEYAAAGVNNLLALRGDFPAGFRGTNGDFAHANELISYVRRTFPRFGLAAACYPEKHLWADSLDEDITNLLKKQDAGASFLITQLCYDAGAVEAFLRRIRARGVCLPVVAGVLPILNKDGLIRMSLSNGCSLPAEVAALIGRYGDDEVAFREEGKGFTVRLIERLIDAGVGGIHLYTLNRYDDVADVVNASGLR